uniref:Guanine nucleotide-binding protein subunit beta-like protein n=1 Tax=Noctiluca scintillans TaxID=2966 RepID=A0A7S1ADC4_NOCSC|mmetsp:Transcript_4124/g.11618  ORF Transcript_4124/g.11618 Transcript_4124/m.11618 type:complete len:611 (+) Transcript_4124:76-1908(+)|eukprot:CAMPEP_0194532582 /NCGR_PEP_ID=MMETSP0253-20130528/70170_1 /TAXON_ID=2966 /ORGANISM="Noctiluca scintillans" /LENGTH=610 /DNA_ID=CAMNT_0039378045 /DNA_START=31 /DNA_END=1863 /DNA_ORIENTATION=+
MAAAELEHFIGGSKYVNVVHYHPLRTETLIYAAAATIIVEEVSDPHSQEFLRGHDADISALDVSQNGKLVASGQSGSPYRKGADALVVVWDFDQRAKFAEFGGLAHSVLCVKFSPDGRFLIGTGANQMLFVWDVSTGEKVYSRKTENPCFLGLWGPVQTSQGRPAYSLCTAYDAQILQHQMTFDIRDMAYSLTSEVLQFPSGFQRRHLCGLVRDGFLFTGTSAGEMCVFNLKSSVFRAALPICNNGVVSIAVYQDVVYTGGGDGRVRAMRGFDTQWDEMAGNQLEAGVTALTVCSDGGELVVGTRNGKLFRLLSSDLTASLQSAAHTSRVTDVAFGSSNDLVCTCSDAGEVFLVDLSDYLPVTVAIAKSGACSAVFSSTWAEIVVGYDDGFVRAWSTNGGQLWQTHAHRGGVCVVKESADFIVTGGQDFAVRFWHRSTRELLATFTNHRKPVSDLILDSMSPHLAHSGSEDRSLVTYDLKANKTLIQHSTAGSSITGLSQRKDSEQEVVSSCLDGKVLFWDVDYADPVSCLEGGASVRFRCVDVSPKGRYIAAGAEDARIYIFDLVTSKCIQQCTGHSDAITRLRWSPDQKQIVSAGRDGCVIVWNFFEV